MRRETWKWGVAGLGLWLCLAPAASVAQIVVRTAAPVVREAPPPRRSGYIWDATDYEWRGGRYVRVPGRFIPDRRGFVWVPGRWEFRGGSYRWYPGAWHPVR